MTIKELEETLGVARANIRYYEQEGLVAPLRRKNGYRDYSADDVQELKKIKLLRELDVPLADIRKLQAGELALEEEMCCRLAALKQQGKAMEKTQAILADIRREKVSYERLDADRYFTGAFLSEREAGDARKPQDACKPGDAITSQDTGKYVPPRYLAKDQPQQPSPICRLLARTADLALYTQVCICVVSLFHLDYRPILEKTGIAVPLSWIFVEPLLLCLVGTTAGKWVFGYSLADADGRRLSYRAALRRSFKVAVFGMGLYLPLIRWYCMYKSWKSASEAERHYAGEETAGYGNDSETGRGYAGEETAGYGNASETGRRYKGAGTLAWEEGAEFVYRKSALERWTFGVLKGAGSYLLLAAVCCAGLAVTYGCILYAQVPVNRGRVTMEEFVENFNQAVAYLGYTGHRYQLKPDGTFYTSKEAAAQRREQGRQTGSFSVDVLEGYEIYNFSYVFDGAYLERVSMQIDVVDCQEGTSLIYPRVQMAAAVYALAGASRDVGFWNDERGKLMQALLDTGIAQGFSYEMGGMRISCDAECRGFEGMLDYIRASQGKNRLYLDFMVGNTSFLVNIAH